MQIASRILTYRDKGHATEIMVALDAPIRGEKDWSCTWSINWPHALRNGKAYGIDSVQALEIALQMIGTEIYSSAYHKTGLLYFEKEGDGYGFPLPQNLRDLLIGQDKFL